ncbi:MAG TPA: glycosyltransferase, partial [Candidatus Limnocylindria bacterium]|nr:glycosyltransferase [Candidatus Limnocylindria bacterium]
EARIAETNPRPRVAIHLSTLAGHYGGAERVMLRLAEGLHARGVQVELVLVGPGPPERSELPERVPVVELRWPRRGFSSLPLLAGYLRRVRPDLLLTIMPPNNLVGLGARALAGVRTRVIVQDVTAVTPWLAQHGPGRAPMLRWLMRRFYPQAAAVVVNATGVARDLERAIGFPAARAHVVHISTVTPELLRRAHEPAVHPWLGPGAPPLVTSLGRLAPEKDYPTLLRAFARVVAERDARLLILGEGPERPRLERLILDLGLADRAALAGFLPNPHAVIAASSLFVLSSAFEGLPNTLIEALACGTPVVATDCDSGPREILADGAFGRLVPVGDERALAGAIVEALQAPVDREALRSRALEFSLERAVERYLDVMGLRAASL